MKKIYFFLLTAVACSLQMNATEGALQGRFTINANGDQVVFSQGNLQYQASTQTWRFAENQYDYVGDATNGNVYVGETKSNNSLISDTYDGWIDLFGWGTGDAPTKTSTNEADYATFTDWGTNPINNGGEDTWRTPTREEWKYLFLSRENAATLFGLGSVDGAKGLIILPDNWVLPEDASFTASTTVGLVNKGGYYEVSSYSIDLYVYNILTAEEWTVLEAAGAVFLPATGYRFDKNVDLNEAGIYWTPDQSTSEYGMTGADLFFRGVTVQPSHSRDSYFGHAVRLVKDIDTTPIENVQRNNVLCTKVIIDGELYIILPDDKVFNAIGVRVQ